MMAKKKAKSKASKRPKAKAVKAWGFVDKKTNKIVGSCEVDVKRKEAAGLVHDGERVARMEIREV